MEVREPLRALPGTKLLQLLHGCLSGPARRPKLSAVNTELHWEIGQRLRDVRLYYGFTQEEMARAMRMHRPNYVDIERGRRFPQTVQLRSLALRLGVDLHWVLTGEGAMLRRDRREYRA